MQNRSFNNIAFIGGIHGVGKSSICRQLCVNNKVTYLSASELLKWSDMNEDGRNKKVTDIPVTQNKLIDGLNHTIQTDTFYLLDGHYCLLDSEMKIVKIPKITFQQINPVVLYLIIGDSQKIKDKLEERDRRLYDLRLLDEMQTNEVAYARELATSLNIVLQVADLVDFSNIQTSLNQIAANYERLAGY